MLFDTPLISICRNMLNLSIIRLGIIIVLHSDFFVDYACSLTSKKIIMGTEQLIF